MRFSQRAGITPASKLAQRESMDEDLRVSLWNLLSAFYWKRYKSQVSADIHASVNGSNLQGLITDLWHFHFKRATDTIPRYWKDCYSELRALYFRAEWYAVYDFIEFIASRGFETSKKDFIYAVNLCLESENSAYRFVGNKIAEITSAEEIAAVEEALSASEEYQGTKTHLRTALALLSDRNSPDFRNSIKESISAVESLARKLAQDDSGTLGAILGELERSKKLHPALKKAFSSLYGYTNDADGIRHALLDENGLTKTDAKFMLVCCSAFVNYAIDSIRK